MSQKTDLMRYNIAERGRKYMGTPRNYDVASVVAVVNSPAVQSRVKMRDMLGYYTHSMRDPMTGEIKDRASDDQLLFIEPALVTTYLKAYANGDIEHRAEFTKTKAGKLAQALYGSSTGGFSSLIPYHSKDGLDYATDFKGFDYVRVPNYTANRGYAVAMDDASGANLAALMMQDDLLALAQGLAEQKALSVDLSELLDASQAELLKLKRQRRNSLDDLAQALHAPIGGEKAVNFADQLANQLRNDGAEKVEQAIRAMPQQAARAGLMKRGMNALRFSQ